jgi:hypothetical protein
LSHGNAEYVRSAAPSSKQICANILLVHKGRIFEQHDVWLHVYDGSLPDVMLSEDFCNDIPCISHPGEKLIDTRERPGDRELLWQCMEDYKGLIARRFTHPEPTTSRLHFASINAALSSATGVKAAATAEQPRGPDDADTLKAPKTEYQRGAKVKTAADEAKEQEEAAEKKRQLLKDVIEQRERLRARLGKPVSDEALQSATSILERYPENFRPPGSDACTLAVFTIKLKDQSKYHVALPRRTNPIVLQDMRRQIEELLLAGAIERCQSQPSSVYAVVMAKRPGQPGKWRLCIDLKNLNSNTVPMPYAMPDVMEAIDRLSGKKYYSSFDFSS